MKRLFLASVVMVAVVLPAQAALLSQLAAQWDFEGPDATIRWLDKTGNGADITVRNRINVIDGSGTLFDGYSGQSAGYEHPTLPPGKNATWAKVVSGGNFNRTSQLDPIAVEFWFKPLPGVNGDMIQYGGQASSKAFSFSYLGNNKHFYMELFGDEDGGGHRYLYAETTSTVIGDGGWSHVRFIYDGTTIKAWHNEDEVLNEAWTHGVRNPQLSSTTPLEMFSPFNIFSYYNGNLDEVEISTGTIPAELLAGDANRDGYVSAGDYASVQSNFGNTGDAGIPGDANLYGAVSAGDYASVHANFGNAAPTVAVPEPATMSLLGVGVLAMISRKRKN